MRYFGNHVEIQCGIEWDSFGFKLLNTVDKIFYVGLRILFDQVGPSHGL